MSVLVENLTVRYGDLVAVDNVSFEAPTGSVTVILGPNGAGKTSTIEVCEGFRTGQGHVRVLGLDPVKQHRELTNRMGVMLQGGGVYPSARVKDVIRHFCALHGKGANPSELIQLVGLGARSKSTWRRLSGGEQQRVAVARALINGADIIFADEPTGNLDSVNANALHLLFKELRDEFNRSFVIVTHNKDLASMSDRVLELKDGRWS